MRVIDLIVAIIIDDIQKKIVESNTNAALAM
jgi:hypothetical protein